MISLSLYFSHEDCILNHVMGQSYITEGVDLNQGRMATHFQMRFGEKRTSGG